MTADFSAGSSRGAGALRLPGHSQMALALARQRLAVGILLFGLLVLVVALRLFDLAVLDPEAPTRPARSAPMVPRADIVDRNGVPLATSYVAFAAAARPRDITGDKAQLARRIAAILPERPPEAIAAALHHEGRFRYIARRIRPDQAQALRDLGEPGITLERENDRIYPNLALAAHLVGYTSIDGEGSAGIERAFDARLAAPDRVDEPLVLAMDARVQQVLESELAAEMERQGAEGAAGVVMNVHTGEVLALASLPAYNVNQPGGRPGMPEYINRATLGVYELGSTFKPFTVAMAMDSGVVSSLAQRYRVSGLRIGRHTITDVHRRSGPFSVPEVIIHSSNVATARMAEQMGRQKQEAFLRRLGMMDRAPGEILEKGRPLTPPLGNWGLSSVMTVGFGHGIAVTPLHLANAYATLVNGGIHRPATFLKVPEGRKVPGERVFSEETSRLANGMLRLAVTEGTGRRADAPGYRVGGKTGTAEKPRPGGGYFKNRNITTFAGAFPMDDPAYVVVVMIDDPRLARGAGQVAAPVFRNVVLRIAPVLGVLPDGAREPDLSAFAGLYTPRPKR
jgi:cell division protein FtsI (penicillin-binding protein 3)